MSGTKSIFFLNSFDAQLVESVDTEPTDSKVLTVFQNINSSYLRRVQLGKTCINLYFLN